MSALCCAAPPLCRLRRLGLSYTATATPGLSQLSTLSALTSLSLDSCGGVGDAVCQVGLRMREGEAAAPAVGQALRRRPAKATPAPLGSHPPTGPAQEACRP